MKSTSGSETDFRALFASVRSKPGMYLLPPSYATLVAFVQGCDCATGGWLLHDFKTWLADVLISGRQSSLHWSSVIIDHVSPGFSDSGRGRSELTRDLDDLCVQVLFENLDQYLERRSG